MEMEVVDLGRHFVVPMDLIELAACQWIDRAGVKVWLRLPWDETERIGVNAVASLGNDERTVNSRIHVEISVLGVTVVAILLLRCGVGDDVVMVMVADL